MADNTEQFEWIQMLQGNLDALFPEDFVGGDLLWYPVEGDPTIRVAPDVLVALGRPKGRRGSYIQHREEGVAPQVVIEVLSPGNTATEMAHKTWFYEHYGVREFIQIDPETQDGLAFVRDESGDFRLTPTLDGWTSPTLGIRFAREPGDGPRTLRVYKADGTPFLSFRELEASFRAERERAERLAARLRALGVDPDAL